MIDDIPEVLITDSHKDALQEARAYEVYHKDSLEYVKKTPPCVAVHKNGHIVHFVPRHMYNEWKNGRVYKILGTTEVLHSGVRGKEDD